MTNKQMLESFCELRKEIEITCKPTPLLAMSKNRIHIRSGFFKECEKEGLLTHVDSRRDKDGDLWQIGMTKGGSKVMAIVLSP